MIKKIERFQAFGRKHESVFAGHTSKRAVIYTRVSSKEQAEKNLSLDYQLKTITRYAVTNGFEIAAHFGGTFESAKTDGRKEFQRMLGYISENKGAVSHILVYTMDRFSRTGGAAIHLADDLRQKFGVSVLAVTQPTDATNPGGIFQQNIQLLFSEFDNQLRKQRAMAGMKEKFERGIWCIRPPFGYSIVRENGRRKIIINQQGEILRKAFEWKAKGIKATVILEKLRLLGVELYKQKLSAIFKNPFYAGIVSTKMLDGQVVEGEHEKLITPELFLKIHEQKKEKPGYGAHQKKVHDQLPLKVIMTCSICGQPYTGYAVRKESKAFYYYKCRSAKCRCNKAAEKLNDSFGKQLAFFSLEPLMEQGLLKMVAKKLKQAPGDSAQEIKLLQANLDSINQKLIKLEEKYHVLQEVDISVYEQLSGQYKQEKSKIMDAIGTLEATVSAGTVSIPSLSELWQKGSLQLKERLQRFLFHGGFSYDHEADRFNFPALNPLIRQAA